MDDTEGKGKEKESISQEGTLQKETGFLLGKRDKPSGENSSGSVSNKKSPPSSQPAPSSSSPSSSSSSPPETEDPFECFCRKLKKKKGLEVELIRSIMDADLGLLLDELGFKDFAVRGRITTSLRSPALVPAPVLRQIGLPKFEDTLNYPPPPPIPKEPEFISHAGWVKARVTEIETNFDLQDDTGGDTRVPPLASVRCSRGGKTRALTEIERQLMITLKGRDVVVIRISTNDFSGLDDRDDLNDHIQILCRRIAFFLLHPYNPAMPNPEEHRKDQWRAFDGTVSKEVLEEWLKGRKCILLIDELNNLGVVSRECATWLKNVFLGVSGRYLVFTSHIVSTSSKLIDYMEPRVAEGAQQLSRRGILVKELPLVPNLRRARQLDGRITSQKALYLGLIPSLIHVHAYPGKSPVDRARRCAEMCLGFGENSSSQTRDSVVTDSNVRLLLHSFLSGSVKIGMDDLLPLLSVGENKETSEESCSSSSSSSSSSSDVPPPASLSISPPDGKRLRKPIGVSRVAHPRTAAPASTQIYGGTLKHIKMSPSGMPVTCRPPARGSSDK